MTLMRLQFDQVHKFYRLNEYNDDYLRSLFPLFSESIYYFKELKKYLTLNEGYTGNVIEVDIRGETAHIGFEWDLSEDSYITMPKQELQRLVDEWLELNNNNPDEIIFERVDEGPITLRGVFYEKEKV